MITVRLLAVCLLFTFGSILSATIILLEYNHFSETHVGDARTPTSSEDPVVAELKKQILARDQLIEQLKNTPELQELQKKITELESKISEQVSDHLYMFIIPLPCLANISSNNLNLN